MCRCIDQWLRLNSVCPCCRESVLPAAGGASRPHTRSEGGDDLGACFCPHTGQLLRSMMVMMMKRQKQADPIPTTLDINRARRGH